MKLGFFNDWTLGVVKDDTHMVEVSEALGGVHAHTPQDLITLVIENFDQVEKAFTNLAKVSKGVPLDEITIQPPIPRPDKIVCMAVNYLEYGQRPMPDFDAFLKDSDCVIGDGDTIFLDPECNATIFHHEAELAVVMGKDSYKVAEKDAYDHIFGYTGFIDVSARGFEPQGRMSFFQVKSWNTFGPMGPFIVTKDEVPDPHNVNLKISNNDQGFQEFNTSDMAHKIPECVEWVTKRFPLSAGDIISTGTNHQGLGPLQNGDHLTFGIDAIGSMHLHVEDPSKREWERKIDEGMAEYVRKLGT
ncbi:MAG: fumarylacetoacetate hydrolase family protein [Dehalococcoidia bacterium]